MDIIRVLRVLEYVGPRAIVEKHLKTVVYGVRPIGPDSEVRASTIGLTADIIEMGKVEGLISEIKPREFK